MALYDFILFMLSTWGSIISDSCIKTTRASIYNKSVIWTIVLVHCAIIPLREFKSVCENELPAWEATNNCSLSWAQLTALLFLNRCNYWCMNNLYRDPQPNWLLFVIWWSGAVKAGNREHKPTPLKSLPPWHEKRKTKKDWAAKCTHVKKVLTQLTSQLFNSSKLIAT